MSARCVADLESATRPAGKWLNCFDKNGFSVLAGLTVAVRPTTKKGFTKIHFCNRLVGASHLHDLDKETPADHPRKCYICTGTPADGVPGQYNRHRTFVEHFAEEPCHMRNGNPRYLIGRHATNHE